MKTLIYEGKAKKLYRIEGNNNEILMEFKDSLTAFNGVKKGSFDKKGELNREMASLIFRYLTRHGVKTHWLRDEVEGMIVRPVEIIPIEVVVRNILAGSTAKRLGIAEGQVLKNPLVEFYYKNDVLNDPFISDDQALMLNLASKDEVTKLKEQALSVNSLLNPFFKGCGLQLIDFKLEFGRDQTTKTTLLADEITPDSCRLWDEKTGERMDKDRFRRDLGQVDETYQEVWRRMKSVWEAELSRPPLVEV